MDDTADLRLAFLDVCQFEENSVRGGILVTNAETLPFEFRATSMVRPTPMQRILYGARLVEYVYKELICFPLVNSVREKITLVLVKDKNLSGIRAQLSVPVVFISRDSNGIFTARCSYKEEEQWTMEVLGPITQQHDIMEPFERLSVALTEVHRQRPETK